jgi:Transglutaminase-like superfamily
LLRFCSLDPGARTLIVEATLLPLLISFGFRTFGVPRTQAFVRRWTSMKTAGSESIGPSVVRQAMLAQIQVKRTCGLGGTCLVRSFTLWALLLRRGVPAVVQVGFRKRDGKIEGHAWVEISGQAVNETPESVKTYQAPKEPIAFDQWR